MQSGGCKTLYITLTVIAVLEHLRMHGASRICDSDENGAVRMDSVTASGAGQAGGCHGIVTACKFPDSGCHRGCYLCAYHPVFLYGFVRNSQDFFLYGDGVGGHGAEIIGG